MPRVIEPMDLEATSARFDLEHEMKKSFISYAMAVIITRALPDVRDGLKPVHRRILYSMHELGVRRITVRIRKCARIVGDVLGKYHPHGDSSVYDALVRLAQDFSMRLSAGGRSGQLRLGGRRRRRGHALYRSAHEQSSTMEMLADIDKETVDFIPNFDETLMQPNGAAQPVSRTCWSTAPPALPSAWRPTFRRTTCGEVIDGVVKHDRQPGCDRAGADGVYQGPGFPDRRHHPGHASGIRDTVCHRPRPHRRARAETEIEPMPQRPSAHRRDGNPVHGQQGRAGREDRRAGARQAA